MKKITTLLFILLSMPFYAQWVEQNSGVTAALNDVYCITEDFVVVVGDSGTILKTTNGGINWIQKTSGTSQSLLKVQFVNPNVGYAAGVNGTLLKTSDGGETWLPLVAGQQSYSGGLSCLNENIFYVCSDSGIKKTTDGGTTFEILNTPANQAIENIQFLSEQIGYASTYGSVLKTADGGATWTVIANDEITSFYFINENIGFVATRTNGIYKTADGGLSVPFLGYIEGQNQDLFALNENIVWEVNGLFFMCGCQTYCVNKRNPEAEVDNQGINHCFADPYDLALNAIHFANDTKGFTVGHWSGPAGPWAPTGVKGVIFKNSTGDNIELGLVKNDKKDAVKIYPNPASELINISFTDNQTFSVEITDALGKKIYSKSYQLENHITINTASLSKGVYFLTIVSGEKRQTQKLMIN